MVDNPKLDTVIDFIVKNNLPVTGHLGEPKNCWLPLDKMTVNADSSYFAANPQYICFFIRNILLMKLRLMPAIVCWRNILNYSLLAAISVALSGVWMSLPKGLISFPTCQWIWLRGLSISNINRLRITKKSVISV